MVINNMNSHKMMKKFEPAVRQSKKMVPAKVGRSCICRPVFLILLYGIAITILKRFDIKSSPMDSVIYNKYNAFYGAPMGFIIVLRGEYRDRHKGMVNGIFSLRPWVLLMVVNWLPLIFALTSTFFRINPCLPPSPFTYAFRFAPRSKTNADGSSRSCRACREFNVSVARWINTMSGINHHRLRDG